MVFELKAARKAYGPKVVLDSVDLHIERGDRIALVGHNGAGKSTLMRLLSAEEPPDRGTRVEGHQVVMQYFAQDEATRLDPRADRLRDALVRIARRDDSRHSQHPRRLPVLGRRRLQEGGGAVGRRANAPGRRAHAAPPVEHAAARRADQSPRSRFEGSAARRARRLRRHAGLRVARSLLRRAPRDANRRGRRRQGDALSGDLRGVSVVEGTRVRQVRPVRRRCGCDGAARRRAPAHLRTARAHLCTAPHPSHQSHLPHLSHLVLATTQQKRDAAERRKREKAVKALSHPDRRARNADRRTREPPSRSSRRRWPTPGFYDSPSR